jgi:23S rRNA (uridine2552-2'-O)-methyltransferase
MRRSEDHFSRRARQQGFPARSVFKLQEMQARYRLIRPGQRILDLGAAPGSWSRFCLEKLGGRGQVVAVDLNDPSFQPPAGDVQAEFRFLKGDLFSAEIERQAAKMGPYDLVLSDAAPHTSGASLVDSQASLDLARRAFELACICLKPGGNLVVKVFQGGEEGALLERIRGAFARARPFKPAASRSESREVYFLGFEKKACGQVRMDL